MRFICDRFYDNDKQQQSYMTLLKVGDFYNWRSWENSAFLSDPAEISFLTTCI